MSAPGLRLRLKSGHRSRGFVQGGWWPWSTELMSELPALLAALWPRVGRIDRVIYDENSWATTSLRIEFRAHSVILDGSGDQSANTLSVIGPQFGTSDLLVVPPYTDSARAYAAVVAAADPDDVSTPDDLLGIASPEVENRRLTLMAHQRWESEGGALRHRKQEVQHA
ncbi:MAG TPA: DUF5994 family protein [Mycobacterium sp.]|nr:DUF5994 family protein [Mycobacterium sp.]